MAGNKIYFAVIVIIIVTFLQITLSEARPLKKETGSVSEKMSPTMTQKSSSVFEHFTAVSKDDFRPTAPGFSPGVGHPVFGTSEVAKPNAALAGANSGVGTYKVDDFRPTGPGHIPGVGHAVVTKIKPEAEPRN